ncbi:hypothetical protein EPA93_29160 [Ktedonosporobacter rubrisoli]|uniref:Uncharacterized protein n=1 Tax=Ktedonosporobacter rubrisoli TaxID=2509675 RepID=A0A4P6JWU1_KTERU|nr:hypothetical protein [Ktedonosporobacter rubrisoli]QBD79830.1 hypothetical protein EPA93_29160 [Ktedonosporobacter rubrisoli]
MSVLLVQTITEVVKVAWLARTTEDQRVYSPKAVVKAPFVSGLPFWQADMYSIRQDDGSDDDAGNGGSGPYDDDGNE